jgi:hypothetical protein
MDTIPRRWIRPFHREDLVVVLALVLRLVREVHDEVYLQQEPINHIKAIELGVDARQVEVLLSIGVVTGVN